MFFCLFFLNNFSYNANLNPSKRPLPFCLTTGIFKFYVYLWGFFCANMCLENVQILKHGCGKHIILAWKLLLSAIKTTQHSASVNLEFLVFFCPFSV